MVRQLFEQGVVQSGFWHQFAMTAHSPVGLFPDKYMVSRVGPDLGGFADNDLYHEDPTGVEHELFSQGLKTALFNYMHGTAFEMNLAEWFDFDIPPTSIVSDYVYKSLDQAVKAPRSNAFVVWLSGRPVLSFFEEETEEGIQELAALHFYNKQNDWVMEVDVEMGEWLSETLVELELGNQAVWTFKKLKDHFEATGMGTMEEFFNSYIWEQLSNNGLLIC
jgi:hypothetical protein